MVSPPVLWPSSLTPADEVDAVKSLNAHLWGLHFSVKNWEASLALYRVSQNPPPGISRSVAHRWRFIACNECVLELYHLRARLTKIQSVLLKNCASLRPYLDVSMMRSARKSLDDQFPHIEALRHAIAHKGENEAHPEVHAPVGRSALAGFAEVDRYSDFFEGERRHLDITGESLTQIEEVVSEFVAAFQAAADELKAQGHLD